ncbi:MAG: gamma-glutamylcyclotransferase family protein [Chloroflexota bacterium]
MKRLFIYGTLMLGDVQRRVIGRVVPMQTATLNGYRKDSVTLGIETYPRITVDADTFVEGAVIELTDDELVRVDHYEGSEYVRIVVTLTDDTAAWAYAEPPSDD